MVLSVNWAELVVCKGYHFATFYLPLSPSIAKRRKSGRKFFIFLNCQLPFKCRRYLVRDKEIFSLAEVNLCSQRKWPINQSPWICKDEKNIQIVFAKTKHSLILLEKSLPVFLCYKKKTKSVATERRRKNWRTHKAKKKLCHGVAILHLFQQRIISMLHPIWRKKYSLW